MRVAIIGGGLAGCSVARALKHGGAEPVIYEAGESLASGASGNRMGLYNPRIAAERSPQSDYFVAAYSLAVRLFSTFTDVDWSPYGALHLITDEKRRQRYEKMCKNWQWEREHVRIVDAVEASSIAGVLVAYDALYLPDSGAVSPNKLCVEYARGIDVRLNSKIEDFDAVEADVIVLANGMGAKDAYGWLPLKAVRGQITDVRMTERPSGLRCNVCYGGYISPADDKGVHVLGSTFQNWLDHDELRDEDNTENIEKLSVVLPKIAKGLEVVGCRASVRTTVKDHFPVVGQMPNENVYISVGHGSHGIISSLIAAELLADVILGRPCSLSRATVEALSPVRFLEKT